MGFFLQGSDRVTPDFTKCAESSDSSSSPVQELRRLRWSGRRAGWGSMNFHAEVHNSWDFHGFWSVSQDGPHCSCWLFPWIRGFQFLHPVQPVSLTLCCENSSFAIKAYPPLSLFCPSFCSPFTFSLSENFLFFPHLSSLPFSSDCSFRSQTWFIFWISGIRAEPGVRSSFLAA